jgi:hypothetical protein
LKVELGEKSMVRLLAEAFASHVSEWIVASPPRARAASDSTEEMKLKKMREGKKNIQKPPQRSLHT